jgi:hypothetical protein
MEAGPVPESKKRKKKRAAPPRRPGRSDIPPVDGIVRSIMRGGDEMLQMDEPLEVELWASSVLGFSYKRLPIDVQDRFDRAVFDGVLLKAERRADSEALAVVRALAAVAPEPLSASATEVGDRLVSAGCPEPPWADELGTATFERAWTLSDPYDDQMSLCAYFRYPDRPEHVLMILYDENLGAIIKDASAGAFKRDPLERARKEPDAVVADIDQASLVAKVLPAILSGDMFLDNDWTDDFRDHRALLLARMRAMAGPGWEPPEWAEPLGDEQREGIVEAFFASPGAPADDDANRGIVDLCLTARCDYGDGDPFRWSPIVVEMFMLDFVPRKATIDTAQIRALPDVLKAFVRYSLGKRRGLGERWIEPSVAMVDELTGEFRQRVTDADRFGSAKAIANAMLSHGVSLTDPKAMDAWIEEFNARSFEERDRFLGGRE